MLYVEAHPDLEGEETTLDQRFSAALRLIEKANNNQTISEIDQAALNKALKQQSGEPIAIYERLPSLSELSSVPVQESAPAVTPKLVRQASPDGYYHGN